MSYVHGKSKQQPNLPTMQHQIHTLQTQVGSLLVEREALRQTIETLTAQLRAMYVVPANHRKHEAVCGTYSGYQKHLRDKDTPCYPCKAARAEYTRNYRKRTLKAAA